MQKSDREPFTTTINKKLIKKTKLYSIDKNIKANDVIEKALKLLFETEKYNP